MTEHEEESYFRAARFPSDVSSRRAYFQSQHLIEATPCELSSYRLQLRTEWHVAIVGRTPAEELRQRLERILATGEVVSLPEEVERALYERSAEMRRLGPWSEGHYR